MAGAAGVDPDLLPAAGAPTVLQPPGLPQQEATGKGKGNGGWKRRMVGERTQDAGGEARGSGGEGEMMREMKMEMDRMWREWMNLNTDKPMRNHQESRRRNGRR